MASVNPFDFVDSISYTKEDLIGTGKYRERDYSPFLTNRALSYHSDSVLYANEMNFWRDLDGKLQYDYLRISLRRARRRSKWHKADDAEAVGLVSWRYGLSAKKAREALALLTDRDVDEIRKAKESMRG